MRLLGLVAILSLIPLVWVYISENWISSTEQQINKPVSLVQLFREWLIYVLLFTGLTTVLDQALRAACRSIC